MSLLADLDESLANWWGKWYWRIQRGLCKLLGHRFLAVGPIQGCLRCCHLATHARPTV